MVNELTEELTNLKNEMKTMTPRNNHRISFHEVEANEEADGGFSKSELEKMLLERTEELEECMEAFDELQKDAQELSKEYEKGVK